MHFKCRRCWKITDELTTHCDSCGMPNTLDEIDSNGEAVQSGRIIVPGYESDIIDVDSEVVEEDDRREKSVPITEVEEPEINRCESGLEEFDEVLSGGPAFGTTIMIHGDPGVGKSTILAQVLSYMAEELDMKVEFATAEENKKMIVEKVGRTAKLHENLRVIATNDFEAVMADVDENEIDVLVLDSLQYFTSRNVTGGKGSPNQVKYIAEKAYEKSKERSKEDPEALDLMIFITCHENKEGEAAGPKFVEHAIDTMLEFRWVSEEDQTLELRCSKSRVGSTKHVGTFSKLENGTIVSVKTEKSKKKVA